ncbi:MAG: hydroxysqualene dehydroxylase HpnE [Terriglobales bacterium]
MSAAARPTVAVVGGGLAGLAAGCALADAGFQISLLERRPYLGGRASSYQHPGTGEVVDNCQHVLLGCCTNLIDLYRRIGAEDKIRWYRRLTFIEPGGRRSVIEPGILPAPLHSAGSFIAAAFLSLPDKLAIARGMLSLLGGLPADLDPPFLHWLRAHGQTQAAIDRFWKVVLVSALNEDLERMSSRYAAQVFRESFLKSAEAGRLGIPAVPLSELYGIAGDHIRTHGGEVQLRATVESVRVRKEDATLCIGGNEKVFDYVVLAVPFQGLASMLPPDHEAAPLRSALEQFETSPITGIHLWFDRQVTDLDHAVLLDRTIQWMFHKSSFQSADGERGTGNQKPEARNSYIELVVSSSKNLVDMPKQEIVDLAMGELQEFLPKVANAQLLKSTVIKEVNATYAPLPGTDAYRAASRSPWPRVFLAGDWTATGWPATMEGAVRSGYLAAEALSQTAGTAAKFLVPDLAARGLMRLLG